MHTEMTSLFRMVEVLVAVSVAVVVVKADGVIVVVSA